MPPRTRRSATLPPAPEGGGQSLAPANDQSLKGQVCRVLSSGTVGSVGTLPPVDWGGGERPAGAAAEARSFSNGLLRQVRASPVISMGYFQAPPAVYLVNRCHTGVFGRVHAEKFTEGPLPGVVEPWGMPVLFPGMAPMP